MKRYILIVFALLVILPALHGLKQAPDPETSQALSQAVIQSSSRKSPTRALSLISFGRHPTVGLVKR
jgi:hypothetical protein